MKIRRIMSGAMAGVMAVSSSFVMQLPAAAEAINATVISARNTPSWDAIPVNLLEYGIMDSNTSVKITCRVDQTDILTEDGNVPDWAFGVVINNDWSHDTMPHCSYESDKTEFSMTLTAEQLSNNPEFTIQSQLPCASEITVEAIDLQQDSRGIIELKAIDRNVVMWVYDGDWIDGNICGGGYDFTDGDIDGVEFGKTTAGELRTSVKKITTKANPYFSDTANAGADSYVYNIEISMKDANGNETSASGGEIDFTSDGNTYIDTLLDSSMDNYIITGIRLYVSAKTEWDGELNKSRCSNETIRNMLKGTNVLLEIEKSTKEDISLDPITARSVEMTVSTQDGVKYADGYVDLEPGVLSGITLADLVGKYHSLTISAPGYFANSAGIDPADLVYNINMEFSNADDTESRWLDRDLTALTDDCTLYTGNYSEDLLPGAEDFTLRSISIRVTPKMETVDGTDRPVSEALRNYTEDSFLLEFKEDPRSAYDVEVPDRTVTLFTWADDSWLKGSSSTGSTSDLTVPGIESGKTTFAELKENVKSLSASLPYYSDSIGAGQDAFCYKFGFRFSDDSEFFCNTSADLGNKLTMYLDNESESDISTSAITSVFINVEPKMESTDDGKMQAISEKLRTLETGTQVTVELREDTRDAVVAEAPLDNVELGVWSDDEWLVGSTASGGTKGITVPGIEYGKTTFEELKKNVKSLSTTLPFSSDSVGAGREAYIYKFVFEFGENNSYYCYTTAELGETLIMNLDDESPDYTGAITGMTLNVEAKQEDTDGDKQRAVSEKIRSLTPGSNITIEFKEDERTAAVAEVPTYPIPMYVLEDTNFKCNAVFADSKNITVPGIEYGKTTFADLKNNFKSISCLMPYYSDSLGVGSKDLSYRLVIEFEDGVSFFSNIGAEPGTTLVQKIDSIDTESVSASPITGMRLNIYPNIEEISDGKYQATSEKIRNAEVGSTFTYEPVKDERATKQISVTYPQKLSMFTFSDDNWYDGTNASGQVDAELNEIKGLTADELLKNYRSLTISAPGYFSDSMKLGADAFSYQILIGFKNGSGDEDWLFSDQSALNEEAHFDTGTQDYSNLDGFTVNSVAVKFTPANAFTSDGKWQAKSEAIRRLEPNTEIVIELTEAKNIKPEFTAKAGDGQVTLTWNKVDGAERYAVYSYLGGKYTQHAVTAADAYTVTGLTNGTKYGFLVRAYANGKWSAFTADDLIYATPVAEVKPVVRATAGDTKVALSWNAVPGATKYAAYYYLNGKYTAIGTTTATSVVATGLTNGTKYGFLVRAYVNGAWTSFTTADLVYAAPVAAVKPVVRVTAGDTKVALSWNAVPGATKYAAYYYLNGKYTAIGTTTATSVVAAGLTNGTKYGFLVRAYVNGAWTSFTTADLVYAVPAK